MKLRRQLSGPAGALFLQIFALVFISPASAQTIRTDVTPAKAIQFDPDQAVGTSMDILSEKQFDAVYSEPVLKESLSADWGPITYRQNTELTINAWHWNPNGKWSNENEKSGYFTGSSEPSSQPLRKSFGYALPHRGSADFCSRRCAFLASLDALPLEHSGQSVRWLELFAQPLL